MENYYSVYDIDVTEQENNIILQAKASKMFENFESFQDVQNYFNKHLEKIKDGCYYIICFNGNEPIKVSGMILGRDEYGWIFDVAEWDFRVIASVAFGKDLI